jgi:hypothetical protein
MIAGDADVDAKSSDPASVPVTAPVPWSVEQLHALGPVTGPNHRTSVPIVRSTMKDGSVANHSDATLPRTELSFISEGMESWTGRDSL